MDYRPGYNQPMQMMRDVENSLLHRRPELPPPDLFPDEDPPPRPPRRSVALAACLAALIVVVIGLVMALTGGLREPVPGAAVAPANATPIAPEPITRADLMRRYAELAPFDRTATPDNVDKLADAVCERIRIGFTMDELITVATEEYNANATEVLRLMVAYKCPQSLRLFK